MDILHEQNTGNISKCILNRGYTYPKKHSEICKCIAVVASIRLVIGRTLQTNVRQTQLPPQIVRPLRNIDDAINKWHDISQVEILLRYC